jgi:serine/threonine-protein kinase RsbW
MMERQLKIDSRISNIRIVETEIDNVTTEAGINQESYGKIIVATLEAVNNAIIHGNKYDENKSVFIEIAYRKGLMTIKVTDEGSGFVPGEVPDPTMPENIESVNGRGVFLMSHLADEIKFNDKGNSVTMTFKNIGLEY